VTGEPVPLPRPRPGERPGSGPPADPFLRALRTASR
jgi:hypothetical protein